MRVEGQSKVKKIEWKNSLITESVRKVFNICREIGTSGSGFMHTVVLCSDFFHPRTQQETLPINSAKEEGSQSSV
jgi:hypothetical protein